MALRLHGHGRFRRWLGARFGGDEALGNRAWRRILHSLGAFAIVYYVIPNDFFLVAPKEWVLIAALVVILVLEVLRHLVGLQLPTIRDYEAHRIGSYALFSCALVIALLVFPMPIGAAVILGTAIVDPVAGELRWSATRRNWTPWVPLVLYLGLAWIGLAVVGGWPVVEAGALAVLAAILAVAVEGPQIRWMDDDLAMVVVPGVAMWAVAVYGFRLGG
jgi:hypothetical protein